MASTKKMLPVCLLAMHLVGSAAAADTPVPQIEEPTKPAVALTGDAVCTRCHDESETKPILAIYQTKHGVRGDPSTPTCQSCRSVRAQCATCAGTAA